MRQSVFARFPWLLYQAAMAGALVIAAPWLLARRGSHYAQTLRPRLGQLPAGQDGRHGLWLHAVSVGEVGVAATLVRALPPELPLVVTTVTPTGQGRAQAAFARRAAVSYLPFDLGFAVERFFQRFAPRALVLVEGDLWPLVLRAARHRDLPVVVVNGRVSDRSFHRLRWLRPWLDPLLGPVRRFGMQTAEDAGKLRALGVAAERIAVTGNLKYESPEPALRPVLEQQLATLAAGRPLLIAGSTMAGEDEPVLDAFAHLGGGRRALLLVVPRHPERWDEVARLLERRGLSTLRRSQLAADGSTPQARPDVVLLDSLGELAALYRLARGTFIGGTLVATGGHNPLEAARFGVPVAVGPSMHNFREIAGHFDAAAAWARVRDAAGLAAVWQRWLDDPVAAAALGQRGAALMDAHRGALAATLELLQPILAELPPAPEGER